MKTIIGTNTVKVDYKDIIVLDVSQSIALNLWKRIRSIEGNNYFLSLAELKALLPDEAKISYFTGVAIFTPFQDKLARRSARIKRNGELILISDNPKEINEIIRENVSG